MDEQTILEKVKTSLRITTDDFDDEVLDLIQACLADLTTAGVIVPETNDILILQAVKTFCRAHFGIPDNYDKLKASYDEQKAQLSMKSGYTLWSNG